MPKLVKVEERVGGGGGLGMGEARITKIQI